MIDTVFLLLLLAGIGLGCLACLCVAALLVWRAGWMAIHLSSAPSPRQAEPQPYTDEQLLDAIREERGIAIGRALDPYGVELRQATSAEAAGWRQRAANDASWKKPCRPCQLARKALSRVFGKSRQDANPVAAATSLSTGAEDGKKPHQS